MPSNLLDKGSSAGRRQGQPVDLEELRLGRRGLLRRLGAAPPSLCELVAA
jgi:hypothetical protein